MTIVTFNWSTHTHRALTKRQNMTLVNVDWSTHTHTHTEHSPEMTLVNVDNDELMKHTEHSLEHDCGHWSTYTQSTHQNMTLLNVDTEAHTQSTHQNTTPLNVDTEAHTQSTHQNTTLLNADTEAHRTLTRTWIWTLKHTHKALTKTWSLWLLTLNFWSTRSTHKNMNVDTEAHTQSTHQNTHDPFECWQWSTHTKHSAEHESLNVDSEAGTKSTQPNRPLWMLTMTHTDTALTRMWLLSGLLPAYIMAAGVSRTEGWKTQPVRATINRVMLLLLLISVLSPVNP